MRDMIRHRLVPLGVLVVVTTAQSAWWVRRHRSVLTVDRDEGFLLTWAFVVRDAWGDGPRRLATVWFQHTLSAPLAGAITGTGLRVGEPTPLRLMVVPIGGAAILTIAVWSIARSLGARPLGAWLAAALVSTSPVVLWFARAHHQIVPGAAVLAATVAVALTTDALDRRKPSLALGILLGVSVLTRAMLLPIVALIVPSLLLTAGRERRGERTRLVNAALAVATGAAVALTWWGPNGRDTIRYLWEGTTEPSGPAPTSPRAWSGEVRRALEVIAPPGVSGDPAGFSLRAGLVVLVALLALVAIVSALRTWQGGHRADALFVSAIGGVTAGVLLIVREDFPGFSLLVVVLVVPLAAAALSAEDATLALPWRAGAAVLVALVAVQGFVAGFDASSGWTPRALGRDGELASAAELDAWGRGFASIVTEVDADDEGAGTAPAALLTHDFRIDPTTLSHVSAALGADVAWVGPYQGDPALTDADALRSWLRSRPDDLTVVTTRASEPGAAGLLSQTEMDRVTADEGFEVVARVPLPGSEAVIWRR